jgi:6-phosphogluconolactonase
VARTLSPPFGELEVTEDVPGAFARWVAKAFSTRPGTRFVLALSGGPTARRCYERLATEQLDWAVVDVLMGDERCVGPDDSDANQRLVREALLDRVGGAGSFHPMSCSEGPEAYQALLRRMAPPDLVHLGLGPDGHTASLFPDSAVLDAGDDQWVACSRDPHSRNPHDRMTLTLAGIARARLAVFTVVSEEKHDAFLRLCAGEDLPAGRVRAGRVVWLVDPEASGGSP